uniref:Ovule protein n=1 Tax=Heterorhabditis bacteriophora TaxID=37862 RepID=A0A1I7WTD0_HETBA
MRHNELSRMWSDVRKLSQSQSTIRASELEYGSQVVHTFDPSHPKYRCCCGYVHAMTKLPSTHQHNYKNENTNCIDKYL